MIAPGLGRVSALNARAAAQEIVRGRWIRLALFAAAACGALFGLAVLWYQLNYHPLADVEAYYAAATRLNEGEPLYPANQDVNQNTAYFYPPLFAILFRPLALLPFPVAAVIWEAIVVAAFVLTLHRLGLRRRATWIAVGLLGVPIGFVLGVAQAHSLVTFLVTIGSPAAVALAGQLKIFPILAGIWWVGRRDWRGVALLAGWSGALVLFQLVLEPQATMDFAASIGLGWVGEVKNLSPYALSPVLWVVFVVALALAALRWAPTRAGWPLAVALATLAPPRLLIYMPMSLLAALRRPDNVPGPAATRSETAGAATAGSSPAPPAGRPDDPRSAPGG